MHAIVFGLWIAGMLILLKWMMTGGLFDVIFLSALLGVFVLDLLSGWPPTGTLFWWINIGAIVLSLKLVAEGLGPLVKKKEASQRPLQNGSTKRYSEAELKTAMDRTVQNYRADQERKQAEKRQSSA